ncbi:hypothetical protein FOA52_001838 [Chlamydomonas sp. UWO 241]|nr:hypothetical protein FOA52_001838 [Chlamydomonas sp. UWO 241]
MSMRLKALVWCMVAVAVAAAAAAAEAACIRGGARSLLLVEKDKGARTQRTSVPCNPSLVGSVEACNNSSIKAFGVVDYPWGHEAIAIPSDGSPWGIHITGPYPDGTTYLLSWFSGEPDIGASLVTRPHRRAFVETSPTLGAVTTKPGASLAGRSCVTRHQGTTLSYTRTYLEAGLAGRSYMSPYISHVLLTGLSPGTKYYYSVGHGTVAGQWSPERAFTTMRAAATPSTGGGGGGGSDGGARQKQQAWYPLCLGFMGDVGQTANSSLTRDRLLASRPEAVIMVGDNSYADNYDARSPDMYGNKWGSNQNRWDSFAVLWEPLFSAVPVLNCIGNHEVEDAFIAAEVTYATNATLLQYPRNYPFQAYASRYPVPGTPAALLGDISSSLWYSTVLGGKVSLVVLNSYVPFHESTPQHDWAVATFKAVQRDVTPWLFVVFHASAYHSYADHYKEMECFMSVYEPLFYSHAVDLVLSGHVHAYERTHPVYNYTVDACAPIYVTIGDGGNIEGPVRSFVDGVDPSTGKTFCEGLLSEAGLGPLEVADSPDPRVQSAWGPRSQSDLNPPGCPSTSFQAAGGGEGLGPPLVQRGTDRDGRPLGFCQSTQPEWSAYRDPSFGHAVLELTSDSVASLHWHRNGAGAGAKPADTVQLVRPPECALSPGARRARLAGLRHRQR